MRTYLAIDLKSYYASAECAARRLNPLTTNLVVADTARTEKTICLAVSPSLKAYGIPGRARLFEVIQRLQEVNRQRLNNAIRNGTAPMKNGRPHLGPPSFDAEALRQNPTLEVSYLAAPPPDGLLYGGFRQNLRHLPEIRRPGGYPRLFHRRSIYGCDPLPGPLPDVRL